MTNSRQKLRRWLPILAAVLVLALVAGGMTARYMTESRTRWQMISAGFHISSNALSEATTTPTYPAICDPDTGHFTVELYNFEKENIASVSDLDIGYTVTVTGGTLISVVRDGSDVTSSGGTYTLPKNTGTGDGHVTHVLTIDPGSSSSVTVEVKATSPYSKTLRATFSPISKGIEASLEDYEGVKRVVIKTNQYTGPLNLTYGEDLTSLASVNEYVYGWRTGYQTNNAYIANAQKETTYYFELTSASGVSVNGDTITVS